MQAAVTMLTVEGAYIAYALVSRDTQPAFNLLAFLSAVAFVVSVFLSGKGITLARNKGFDGDWILEAGKSYFNAQALALIVGLVLLAAMLWSSGVPKESELQRKLAVTSALVDQLSQSSAAERARLADQVTQLQARIASLERQCQARPPRAVTTPRRSC